MSNFGHYELKLSDGYKYISPRQALIAIGEARNEFDAKFDMKVKGANGNDVRIYFEAGFYDLRKFGQITCNYGTRGNIHVSEMRQNAELHQVVSDFAVMLGLLAESLGFEMVDNINEAIRESKGEAE